jgi:3D (Asp-Asp-Asp) domain-containing protein
LVTATIYHATPEQTDSTPDITASNKKIDLSNPLKHRWIAVSRDLEAKGLTFGVKVCVTGAGNLDGIWTVQDRMNPRWTNRIDFLVNQEIKGGKWENVRVEIINDDNRL